MRKSNNILWQTKLALVVACAILVLAGNRGAAQPATFTWNGNGSDGNWTTGGNWNGGSAPDNPQKILWFPGSTRTSNTNNFAANSAGHQIFFLSGASSFSLYGNAIRFFDWGGTAPKIENSSTAEQSVHFHVTIGNNIDGGLQINPVQGDMIVSGNITNLGNTLNVWGDNSKSLSLAGIVSGTGKLIVQQFSKVKITGASTYTGNTEIDEGEFWLGTGGSFTSNSVIFVGNGTQQSDLAKLWIQSGGQTLTNPITVNAGNSGRRVIGGLQTNGVATFGGSVTLNGPVSLEALNSGGTMDFLGTISGANAVTMTGPGTIRLSGTNSYSSGTTISTGRTIVANAAGLGTGAVGLGGTLEISNVNVTTPNLTLNNGAVLVGSGANARYSKSSFPSIANGAAVLLNTVNAGDQLEIGSAVRNGNASSTITIGGPGIVLLDSGSTASSSPTAFNGSWVLTNGTLLMRDVNALGNPGGSSPRPITLQGGTWTWRVGSSLAAYPVTIFANATIQPNLSSSGAGITHSLGTLSMSAAELSASPGNNVNSGTMTLLFGATTLSGNAAFNVNKGGASMNVILGAVTESGGACALTKSGSGTLTLSGSGSFTGNTMINAGTLALSNTAALATTPVITLLSNSTLDASVLSSGLALASAQTLKGNGTVSGGLVIASNSTVAPGASVGILTNQGALLLASSGRLECEVIDATSPPGSGFDHIRVAGDVGVLASSSSRFTIKLQSLTNETAAGLVPSFNNDSNYLWTMITNISGSVTNFDPNAFTIDTVQFSNDLAGGTFSLETNAGIHVRFTANRAPVANNTNLTRGAGLSLKIKVTNLLANATSDADGDGRELTALGSTTGGGTVTQDDTYIYYSPPGGDGNDSFTYTVRDSRSYRTGDTVRTNTATISITKINTGGIAQTIDTSGGTAVVSFAGIPNFSYAVERSTDLETWTTLHTTNAPGNGLFNFTDTSPPQPSAYYRLRQN